MALAGNVGVSNAQAQNVPVPQAVDPAHIRDNLPSSPELHPAPPRATNLLQEQPVPKANANTTFTFQALHIEGAQSISVDRLMAEWKHAPGETVSVEDVFRFANAVTLIYRRSGYALSFGIVPEQDIRNGNVTIRVVEGFVERIAFTGAPMPRGLGAHHSRIEGLAEKVLRSRPLRSDDLERYLLLINAVPGITAHTTISPSPDTVGGSVLSVEIRHKRIEAEFGYNNYMPSSLGRSVVGGTIGINGLVTGTDRLRVGAYKSIGNDGYYSASADYFTMIGSSGLTFDIFGFYGATRPKIPLLQALYYHGDNSSFKANLRYPLIRSRRHNLWVEVGGGLSNASSELLGSPLLRDRLRFAYAAADYQWSAADQSTSSVRISIEQGLNVLNARGNSRANGHPDYTLLTLDLQRLQPIGRLAGGSVSIVGSVFGQAAATSLLSASECTYGGRRFGRRFDAAELIGDHCLLGSTELRWTKPLEIGGTPVGVQLYGFFDGGRVWQRGLLQPGELRMRDAMSAGSGLRLDIAQHISTGFEASRVVHAASGSKLDRQVRFLGSVSFHF